jgi:hypothetical protein
MVEAVFGGTATSRTSMAEEKDVVPSAATTVAVKFHGWEQFLRKLSVDSLPIHTVCEVKGRSVKVPLDELSWEATVGASK